MPAVQTTYTERMPIAVAGLVTNMEHHKAESRTVETAAGIGFGLACSQGVQDKGAVLGGASAAVFIGISIRDVAKSAGDADKYKQFQSGAFLTEGSIWLTVGGNVAPGNDVTFDQNTGVLSSIAPGAGQFAIAGARWMTTATTGNLALCRLGGALPSA
jgi:hypothetical protein